jgi:hypothetical protein
MYNIKIDLMICNDDFNLLKAPNQTKDEYNAERKDSFCVLNCFINEVKKLVDLNLQGQVGKELAEQINRNFYREIK